MGCCNPSHRLSSVALFIRGGPTLSALGLVDVETTFMTSDKDATEVALADGRNMFVTEDGIVLVPLPIKFSLAFPTE